MFPASRPFLPPVLQYCPYDLSLHHSVVCVRFVLAYEDEVSFILINRAILFVITYKRVVGLCCILLQENFEILLLVYVSTLHRIVEEPGLHPWLLLIL